MTLQHGTHPQLTIGCYPSLFGMYILIIVLWMIWIPLHFINSISFDVFPAILIALYTVTFLFIVVIGLIRKNNKSTFFPSPVFSDRKSIIYRSYTTLILIHYIFGETVLHFLPKTQTALWFYQSLHIICPILLIVFIYIPMRKNRALIYAALAIALPFTASYFSLGNNFGVQYYFFCLFHCTRVVTHS